MAAATESIGFGCTISTSYEQPYHLARRLSTVDHLTGGRVGWNVVTGYLNSAARNLSNGADQAEHDERYAMCEEYMEVVYKLWNSSWRSDAVQLNRETGIYTDPNLVREINHEGKYFTVPGPHICQPSPQRTPVIMQAGTSTAGRAFAAKHAEAIFVSTHSPAGVKGSIADVRAQMAAQGRDPTSLKVLAKFCPILGRTQEEADAKYRDLAQYGDYEGALALFGGWTGVDMAPYGEDEELKYVKSNAIQGYIRNLIKSAPDVNGGKWTKKTLAQHIMGKPTSNGKAHRPFADSKLSWRTRSNVRRHTREGRRRDGAMGQRRRRRRLQHSESIQSAEGARSTNEIPGLRPSARHIHRRRRTTDPRAATTRNLLERLRSPWRYLSREPDRDQRPARAKARPSRRGDDLESTRG
jgi:FMN-dependent oxidoreductase (nitrilotriacetate monooxygenase family)